MLGTRGALLAGGAGRRLGLGVPKALAVLEGRTLLDRALATLREVCDTIVVAMSPKRPLPPELRAGFETVWDPPGAEGPLAAMIAALAPPGWERAVVLGVDYPLARADALCALLDLLPGEAAVVPAPGGRLQPVFAAYAPNAIERLAAAFAAGARTTVPAVEALGPRVLDDDALARVPGGIENWLNVNSAEELEDAARRLRAHAARSRA